MTIYTKHDQKVYTQQTVQCHESTQKWEKQATIDDRKQCTSDYLTPLLLLLTDPLTILMHKHALQFLQNCLTHHKTE